MRWWWWRGATLALIWVPGASEAGYRSYAPPLGRFTPQGTARLHGVVVVGHEVKVF